MTDWTSDFFYTHHETRLRDYQARDRLGLLLISCLSDSSCKAVRYEHEWYLHHDNKVFDSVRKLSKIITSRSSKSSPTGNWQRQSSAACHRLSSLHSEHCPRPRGYPTRGDPYISSHSHSVCASIFVFDNLPTFPSIGAQKKNSPDSRRPSGIQTS